MRYYYKKIDRRNLKTHINLTVGNLYFRPAQRGRKANPKAPYEVVEGFSYNDLYNMLRENKIDIIWIEGPNLGANVVIDY